MAWSSCLAHLPQSRASSRGQAVIHRRLGEMRAADATVWAPSHGLRGHPSPTPASSSRTHLLCGGIRLSRTWRMPTYG